MSLRSLARTSILTSVTLLSSLAAQRPAIRDSTGIRLVENPAKSTARDVYRVEAKPRFSVGGLNDVDPASEFHGNSGYTQAVMLGNGGLAVIDDDRVHLFDASGKRTALVGRKGAGPEDFGRLTRICRTRADTLVLYDFGNSRIAILSATGKIIRTFLSATDGTLTACFADGSIALMKQTFDGTRLKTIHNFTRVGLDGKVLNPIATLSGGRTGMGLKFANVTDISGNTLVYGDADRREIEVYSPLGKASLVFRTADLLQKITSAQLDERNARRIPNSVVGAEREARLREAKEEPHATTFPLYRTVKGDPVGRIWLQTFESDETRPSKWLLFGADGVMAGTVGFPPDLKGGIIEFGATSVLVQSRDAEGGVHFAVHSLVKDPKP